MNEKNLALQPVDEEESIEAKDGNTEVPVLQYASNQASVEGKQRLWIGWTLGMVAVAVIGLLAGAIWLREYLPFVPSAEINSLNTALEDQRSTMQDIESKLDGQTTLIRTLDRPVVVEPSKEAELLSQDFDAFRRDVKTQLMTMQQNWGTLEQKLTADQLSRNEELAWMHYQLAMSYLDQERVREACAQLRKALKLVPDVPLYWNQLGYCHLAQGEIPEAIDAFQKYVRLAPDDPNAHDSLAEGYLRAGQLEVAEQQYLRALQLAPTLPSAHYGLGQVYEQMELPQLAMKQYQSYIERSAGSANQWTHRIQDRLEQLRRSPE